MTGPLAILRDRVEGREVLETGPSVLGATSLQGSLFGVELPPGQFMQSGCTAIYEVVW